MTLTYPHIGNTGTNQEDMESNKIQASGLIIRNAPLIESNWRSEKSLNAFLCANNLVAISDIDTRKLTRLLRTTGAQAGCIMTGDINEKRALEQAKKFPGIVGMDLAKEVSVKDTYQWYQGSEFENRLTSKLNI